ncbi:UNVERIFIED_CONTAM: hypothetical protein FKN15_057493 [Acipenser sinensis]
MVSPIEGRPIADCNGVVLGTCNYALPLIWSPSGFHLPSRWPIEEAAYHHPYRAPFLVGREIYNIDHFSLYHNLVSICLECNSSKLGGLKRKWIRCSAQATVLHLKKFIAKKLNLASFNELDILCNEEILGKDHTLKFVVVTRWRFKVWYQVLFVKYINTSHGFALGMQPAFCQTTLTVCFF